jgi:hypothetical protein
MMQNGHCNVINNIKAAMAKMYICNACDTLYYNTHKCDKSYSLCAATPHCTNLIVTHSTGHSSVRSIFRIV